MDLYAVASSMTQKDWEHSLSPEEIEQVRANALSSREAFESYVAPAKASIALLSSAEDSSSDSRGGKRARKVGSLFFILPGTFWRLTLSPLERH